MTTLSDRTLTIELSTMTEPPKWVTTICELPKLKGSYLLVLHLSKDMTIKVGKLGSFDLLSGNYYYVGSAMGEGGIASRVGRHFVHDKDKKLRWHIDYLRAQMQIVGSWIWDSEVSMECDIAKELESQRELRPIAKVGSSDCRCRSHLFYQADGIGKVLRSNTK